MRITRQLLLDVGVCGTYVRRFSELFPRETHPDGVELNREVCTRYADDFDWPWAVAEFLNWNGRQRWEEQVSSRSAEARAFGTGVAKKAALFGYLFEQPEYRNPRVVELARTADERADQRALEAVGIAQRELAEAQRQVEYWTDQVPRREAALAEREAATASVRHRQAARAATAAADRVAQLDAQLTEARAAAEAAAAALAELPPEPEPSPAESPADATPAEPQPEPATVLF